MKLISSAEESGCVVAVVSMSELRQIAEALASIRYKQADPVAQRAIARSETAIGLALVSLGGGFSSPEVHLIEHVARYELDPEVLFEHIEVEGHVQRMREAARQWISTAEDDSEVQLGHRILQLADEHSQVACVA